MYSSSSSSSHIYPLLSPQSTFYNKKQEHEMPAKKEGLSRLTAAFNIVKCNWGIGMMAMPYSTHNVPQCSTPFLFNQMTQMRESLKACDLELHRHRCHNVKEERFGHILLSNTNTAARWVYCMLGIPRWHLSFYCTFPPFLSTFSKTKEPKKNHKRQSH